MINERKLTPAELKKREDIIMNMKGNKRDLVKKYGKDAEAVMYGRATNMAKRQTENMRDSKITELIKDALKNPKKVKEDYDGGDLESGAYGDPVDAELDITTAPQDHTEEEAELGLEEDVDLGHEDDEPGMLQGDLYQIGKSAMEIYELLDAMEGEGEVDLPSWWQSKIYKAKEAIVGASEYLEFELKEPAIDAVVDKVAPLDINVEPSVDVEIDESFDSLVKKLDKQKGIDKEEAGKIAGSIAAKKMKGAGSGPTAKQKKRMKNETVEDYITSVDDLTEKNMKEQSNSGSNYGSNENSNRKSNTNPESYSGLKKFVAEKLARRLKEDKDWIQKAIKRPGALHRELGVPQDKDIPKWKMDAAEDRLEAEEERDHRAGRDMSTADRRELRQIDLAKTLEKFTEDMERLKEDRDWIQKAIKRPGALHRALGIPQDKDIPHSLIDKDIRKMDDLEDEEGHLDKRDLRFLRQLDLAKTLEKFNEVINENLPKGYWDKKMDAKDEDQDGKVDESYQTLVNRIKKTGKSEKAAKAIAGAVASYKAKGGGSGPTAKQKKRAK